MLEYLKNLNSSETYILAVSGGVDSMVLLKLMKESNLRFIAAHVNYHLRGKDSLSDENLVRKVCENTQIRLEVLSKPLSAREGSIQLEARNVRQSFFADLMVKYNAKAIITAHHKNDLQETAIFNLFRGTALNGLSSFKHSKYLRPLLNTSKKEIIGFADKYCISFRVDRSNYSNNYSRNLIRNKLLPVSKELFIDAETRLAGSLENISKETRLLEEFIQIIVEKCTKTIGAFTIIDMHQINRFKNSLALLWRVLKPFDFGLKQCQKVLEIQDKPDKSIHNKSYVINFYKNWLIIRSLSVNIEPESMVLAEDNSKVTFGIGTLNFESKNHVKDSNISIAKHHFPIEIRSNLAGDKIRYQNSKTQSKSLKKLFQEYKIPAFLKAYFPVILSNDGSILAIVPFAAIEDAIMSKSSKNTSIKVNFSAALLEAIEVLPIHPPHS